MRKLPVVTKTIGGMALVGHQAGTFYSFGWSSHIQGEASYLDAYDILHAVQVILIMTALVILV